jgi:hypothetical protein
MEGKLLEAAKQNWYAVFGEDLPTIAAADDQPH